jgi:hypothetical protein
MDRVVSLKTPFLAKFRDSLRLILLLAAEREHKELIENSMRNEEETYRESKRVAERLKTLEKLMHYSICICHHCRKSNKDAVFYDDEIMAPFYYPPLKNNQKEFPKWWLCPDCYQKTLAKISYWRENNYYFLWEYDTFCSLSDLGIDKIEDFYLVLEEDVDY